MDEDYENAGEMLSFHRKFKRQPQTSEDIFVNHEVVQTVQREPTGPAPPGAEFVKKSSCRAAVILLGLLCFFLLIGLIAVVFLFTESKSQWEMETVMLHKRVDYVNSERNQLQASYNILTTEQDQLQRSYNNLVKDRGQLWRSLLAMTTNRDTLQRKLQGSQHIWVIFNGNGKMYQVSSEQKSWEESRRECLQNGAHLMIINSLEEQNFVNQFKKRLWIGLTDSERDGTWKWVDGTRITTSYWNSGEPNGGRDENCGEIKIYNSENSWNDAQCSDQQFWICEKRVSP